MATGLYMFGVNQRESTLYSNMLDLMGYLNIYAWRNNVGATHIKGRFMRFSEPGSGDFLGLLPKTGKFLSVEVKTPEGSLSDDQRKFRREVVRRNGIYIVSITPDELASKLREVM